MVNPPKATPPSAAAPGLSDWLQQVLDPEYELRRELGGGGMSRLFIARERALGRDVVVKVLPPELITGDSVARFQREVAITARLQHPNILPVLRAGQAGELLFYIAPYIEGESLRDRIERAGSLPAADVTATMAEVARALVYAHGRGVVHRDVKPANILLSAGHAVLADFGIARALVPEPHAPAITMTDTRPGTPAYMAPERPDDATADLYALGVVGHEMLTGERPGVAPTAGAILRRRAARGGAIDRQARHLARVIARMLALHPADRYPSADALLRHLASPARVLVNRWRRPAVVGTLVVAAGVALAAAGAALARREIPRDPARDTRVVVLPFVAPGEDATAATGTAVAQRLTEAVADWRDLVAIDAHRAAQGLGARGEALDLDAALDAADRLSAGWLLWGTVTPRGDSVAVVATLYDVPRRVPTRTSSVIAPRAGDDARATLAWRRVVNALMRGGGELPWPSAADQRRESLAAWQAYDDARAALARFDLAPGIAALRRAVATDAQHPAANLWLAQALTWQDGSAALPERAGAARRALARAARLAAVDSLRAVGLLALAEQRFPEACRAFTRLVSADSNDFGGWYGLGECQGRDRAVVRSAASRSGYSFRGSYAQAARAYERAVAVAAPEAPDFAYLRMRGVRYAATNQVRTGTMEGNGTTFAAVAELVNDTVTFVPMEGGAALRVPVSDRALAAGEANVRALRRAYTDWVRLSPRSAAAHASLSAMLELGGTLAEPGDQELGALGEIRLARQLARDPTDRARYLQAQVRQLVKNGDYAAAAALADSGLRGWPEPPLARVDGFAALAALTGRMGTAIRLLQRASATSGQSATVGAAVPVPVPAPLARARTEAVVLSSMGACNARLRELPRRLARGVDATFTGDARAALRTAMLAQTFVFAFPCLRGEGMDEWRDSPDRLLPLQRAALAGDRRAFDRALAAMRRNRGVLRASSVSPDYVHQEAYLLAMMGDTATALGYLGAYFDGIAVAPVTITAHLPPAAGLVRAMALAATLHDAQGNRTEARHWATAVVTLWANADPELQPVVQAMRRIAAR